MSRTPLPSDEYPPPLLRLPVRRLPSSLDSDESSDDESGHIRVVMLNSDDEGYVRPGCMPPAPLPSPPTSSTASLLAENHAPVEISLQTMTECWQACLALNLHRNPSEAELLDRIHDLQNSTQKTYEKSATGQVIEHSAGDAVGRAFDAWIRQFHCEIFGRDVFCMNERHAHSDLLEGASSPTGLPGELKTTNIRIQDYEAGRRFTVGFSYKKANDFTGQGEFALAKSGAVHQILIIRPTEAGNYQIRWPILVTSSPKSRCAFANAVSEGAEGCGTVARGVEQGGPAGIQRAAQGLVTEFDLSLVGFIVSKVPAPVYSLESPVGELVSKSQRRWPTTPAAAAEAGLGWGECTACRREGAYHPLNFQKSWRSSVGTPSSKHFCGATRKHNRCMGFFAPSDFEIDSSKSHVRTAKQIPTESQI